ncbi:hypothetical protein [Salinibaculum rarum]|uniref:hypothetical protein n=1 Tax=Salinibaculum rarum TaxID=3058903 RepID=UPI00265D99C5|nr:hypothetical protein [Salinibaculum sp. KK48]
MAVRRNPGRIGTKRPRRWPFGEVSWYDLLLAVIPLGFALAFVAHVMTTMPFLVAVATGAVVGLVAVVDALFVHPPTRNPPRSSR